MGLYKIHVFLERKKQIKNFVKTIFSTKTVEDMVFVLSLKENLNKIIPIYFGSSAYCVIDFF